MVRYLLIRGVHRIVELIFDSIDVVIHSFFEFVDTDDSEDVAETNENKAKTE